MNALMMTVQLLAADPWVDVGRPMVVPVPICRESAARAARNIEPGKSTRAGVAIIREQVVCTLINERDIEDYTKSYERAEEINKERGW
ncbi:hypothetical protein [Aureimonas sp. AU40]|uniref:hypothetical protein n=1 Tax=Aureimonas sp. AU40 TaxID=1637747 RepID=UPI0007821CC0|nr:hypothetical protein [Aureimonas sp. AU40]